MQRLTVGSLFAGIGGIDLGLERTGGFETAWFSEINHFANAVLEKHWPAVPNFGDIRDLDPAGLPRVDVLAGGFPCQNISSANVKTRSGLRGEASGLWFEFERIVAGMLPEYVVVENSAAGWKQWVPDVRGALADLGYETVPVELTAASLGAPHKRARAFVVAAYADSDCESTSPLHAEALELCAVAGSCWREWGPSPSRGFRVDDGLPGGMDRLRALGNAVVPQAAEVIGRLILADHARDRQADIL